MYGITAEEWQSTRSFPTPGKEDIRYSALYRGRQFDIPFALNVHQPISSASLNVGEFEPSPGTGSSTIDWPNADWTVLSQPVISIERSAQAEITDRVKWILNWLLPWLERAARANYVVLSRIDVYGSVDPEEDSRQVVVRETARLAADDALAYWDRLVMLVDTWVTRLPQPERDIFNSRIAVEVAWE